MSETIKFHKYSGSGNDFILINNLDGGQTPSFEKITKWCKRRVGVGADGVIVVGPSDKLDYSIRIWNADGSVAEMCGNAARSSVHFAHHYLKMNKDWYQFETLNGEYEGRVIEGDFVEVKMTELYDIGKYDVSDFSTKGSLYLNTGVPHTVLQVNNVDDINIKSLGSVVRHDQRFSEGTNVDFFEIVKEEPQTVKLRIYERGVEDETLCCGTGVIATAVACRKLFDWSGEITVLARGGKMAAIVNDDLSSLLYRGEVKHVYSGSID